MSDYLWGMLTGVILTIIAPIVGAILAVLLGDDEPIEMRDRR